MLRVVSMLTARYRLGEELGRGALGRVVAIEVIDATDAPDATDATDATGATGPRLAGKILHRSHRADPRAVARFAAEAKVLAGIQHPNLVAVHGLVEIDGETVLLMDRIDGPDLATRLAVDGPMTAAATCGLGQQLASGLAVAHRAGIIHRDLKPGNVLLDGDGVARLGDFGMARASSFAGVDREAFAVAGTPDYMAPESIDPQAVDTRADLYALGCVLCEAVTGAPPFRAPTAFALLEAHRLAPVPELSEVAPPLRRVIRWLLAKSPADRPQSATAVAHALAEAEASLRASDGHAATTALAVRATDDELVLAGTRRCPRCGAAGLAEVAVCFACRAPQVTLEPGGWSVFVTGPGAVTHKLDVGLRQRLLDWLRANPGLGLDLARLTRAVPRLPFPLVVGVSERSAAAMVQALAGLGFVAEPARGGRFALAAMRTKGWRLSGRIAAITAASGVGIWHSFTPGLLVIAPLLAVGSLVAGYRAAGAPATARGRTKPALPSTLAAALDRVAGVVPAIAADRHRDALRGAVERALRLRAALPPAEAARIEPDLAMLIDRACVAAARLDELEASLDGADLRDSDAAVRERWRMRDRWAARLLEVTAFLDGLRARWVSAAVGTAGDPLDELRAQVAALAEVEALLGPGGAP